MLKFNIGAANTPGQNYAGWGVNVRDHNMKNTSVCQNSGILCLHAKILHFPNT
jgi:hypothetical protein